MSLQDQMNHGTNFVFMFLVSEWVSQKKCSLFLDDIYCWEVELQDRSWSNSGIPNENWLLLEDLNKSVTTILMSAYLIFRYKRSRKWDALLIILLHSVHEMLPYQTCQDWSQIEIWKQINTWDAALTTTTTKWTVLDSTTLKTKVSLFDDIHKLAAFCHQTGMYEVAIVWIGAWQSLLFRIS